LKIPSEFATTNMDQMHKHGGKANKEVRLKQKHVG